MTAAFGSVFYLSLAYLLLRLVHRLERIETLKGRLPYWAGFLALACVNVAAWGVMLFVLNVTRVRRRLIVFVLFGSLMPCQSLAQVFYGAEELRDLGRPVTPGAVALGLGGTLGSGLGEATDITFNPAALVLGPRRDVVMSIGAYRYGRKELQRTRVGQSFQDNLASVVSDPAPIGSAAVAFRSRRFAVGGYYDGTSRLDYSRNADRVRWASPVQLLTDQRLVSLAIRHDRLGAGFGVVLPGNLASIGFVIHARGTRMRYDGAGTFRVSSFNVTGREILDDVYDDQAGLHSNAWNVGMTFGALMQPHPRVNIGVRYVREPSSRIVLSESTFSQRRQYLNISETRAFLDAPDLLSAGTTVRIGGFRVVGEAGVVLYAQTFRDASPGPGPPGHCSGVPLPTLPPLRGAHYAYPCWRLYTAPVGHVVEMANGGDVRVGVERGWHRGNISWWARGGATREAAPVLQTVPQVQNAFVPTERDRTWIHLGGGVRVGRIVADLGFAMWQRQYRLLVDWKLATARDSRTAFGSRP